MPASADEQKPRDGDPGIGGEGVIWRIDGVDRQRDVDAIARQTPCR